MRSLRFCSNKRARHSARCSQRRQVAWPSSPEPCRAATGQTGITNRLASTTASHNRPSPASVVKAFPPASSSSGTRITTGSCRRRRSCRPTVIPTGALPVLANPYHAHARLHDLGLNGSYVVYRKLQQDVAGFWQFMKRETARFKGKADAARMVWLAARCVGRWPSGAPLALAPLADDPQLRDRNDFFYRDDPAGRPARSGRTCAAPIPGTTSSPIPPRNR